VTESDELWVPVATARRMEVELPGEAFTVRVGTGRGRTAGIAEFDDDDVKENDGVLHSLIVSGDKIQGELEMSYRSMMVEDVPHAKMPYYPKQRPPHGEISPMSSADLAEVLSKASLKLERFGSSLSDDGDQRSGEVRH